MFAKSFQRLPRLYQSSRLAFARPGTLRGLAVSPQAARFIQIGTGAYLGVGVVCMASFYFLYQDATARQNIPILLPLEDQVLCVKAIGKDDVLGSPRYAVKHYRRLLVNLAKESGLDFSETTSDGKRNYRVPLLLADELIHRRSPEFANFYIDIVLRYARALMAKGMVSVATDTLRSIVDNTMIVQRIGDPERLAQCCRVLSQITANDTDRLYYLERSLDLLSNTYRGIKITKDHLVEEGSLLTDELVRALNALAFAQAKGAPLKRRSEKKQLLRNALNIYLATLKAITHVHAQLDAHELTQASFPLLNCDPAVLVATESEIKAQVSEILWALGYHTSAIAWGEEVVDEIYFQRASNPQFAPILAGVLKNLETMYELRHDPQAQQCRAMLRDVHVYRVQDQLFYESLLRRIYKIMLGQGPLGIVMEPLLNRFGQSPPLPEIELLEREDEE